MEKKFKTYFRKKSQMIHVTETKTVVAFKWAEDRQITFT